MVKVLFIRYDSLRHCIYDDSDVSTLAVKVTNADTTNRKGMYQARILQKVVNVMWFRNKQDKGVVHAAQFSPLTISALALVLAAVRTHIVASS